MRSTVLLTGSTFTVTGFFRMLLASCSISLGMVALNSRFWRWAGRWRMTFFTSFTKPMSSIRSASSSTKISSRLRSTWPWPIRSFNRPGQAVSTSAPRRSASTWGCWPTPPNTTQWLTFRYRP